MAAGNFTHAQTCKPIIAITGAIDLCNPTNNATLTVTNTGVAGYLWSGGQTISAITINTPGVYTVTVTFNSGCTGTTSIEVQAVEYQVQVDQFISTCFDGNQLITITNPQPGVVYNWSIGGGTAISAITPNTGTQATINFTSGNFIANSYYIISYTYGSCNKSDTFFVMPCCDHVWTPQKDFENVLSSTLNPNDFNSASMIHLYGTITIDNVFAFNNCTNILMGPGAQIKIIGGGSLEIANSKLSGGCGRMWRGIAVENGGNLRFAGSTLSDAEIGINLQNNSEIEIGNGTTSNIKSIFENNYIDIKATGDFNNPNGIKDAIFDYTGSFLALYPGQKLIPTNKPFAAFVLLDCGTTGIPAMFGDGSAIHSIQINNHACGFYANNYTFNIYNTLFNNISNGSNYGGFNTSQNGWAVYAKATGQNHLNNTSLLIEGLGKTSTPLTFNNCRGGVFTKSMSATVIDCNMLCTEQGINNKLTQAPSAMHYLRNTINVIGTGAAPYSPTVALNGIYTQFSGTTVGSIAGNDINVNAPIAQTQTGQKSCCIQMDDVTGADNSLMVIATNVLRQLNQTRYGMKFNNITGTQIESNFTYCNQGTLLADNNDLHYCYWSKNCSDLSFTYNFANNINTVYKPNAIGYYNDISPRWIYGCNHAYQIGTGFRFDRDCTSPENFKGNFMENNDYGLYIDKPTGAIGTQSHRGNEWSLASVTGLIPDATLNNGASFQNSQFYVHSLPGTDNFHPSTNSLLWFVQQSGTPYSCAGTDITAPPDTITIIEAEVQHADTTTDADNGAMGDYVLNRNLYAAIDAQYASVAASTLIQNYYDSMSLAAIGQLRQASNSFKNNLNPLATLTHGWQDNDSIMRSQTLQIMGNNKALQAGNLSSTDSNTLVANNAALQQQNQLLATNNTALANAAKWYHENNAADAISKVNYITTTNNFEFNQKAIHQIYARTIAQGNSHFTPADITALYNIAQQCLSYGGPAVLEARPMYALINPAVNFDAIPCNLGNNRWGTSDEATTVTDALLVYPNPASDFVQIIAPVETAMVIITDAMGHIVYKGIIKQTYYLPLHTFKAGLYVVTITTNDGSCNSGRLQIIKY